MLIIQTARPDIELVLVAIKTQKINIFATAFYPTVSKFVQRFDSLAVRWCEEQGRLGWKDLTIRPRGRISSCLRPLPAECSSDRLQCKDWRTAKLVGVSNFAQTRAGPCAY